MAKRKQTPKIHDLAWVGPLVVEIREAAKILNDIPENAEITMDQAERLDDLRVASSRLYDMAEATIPR